MLPEHRAASLRLHHNDGYITVPCFRSELLATDSTGSARKAAERRWLALYTQHGLPVHIFRLGGIYGPSRSALDAVKRKVGLIAAMLAACRTTNAI